MKSLLLKVLASVSSTGLNVPVTVNLSENIYSVAGQVHQLAPTPNDAPRDTRNEFMWTRRVLPDGGAFWTNAEGKLIGGDAEAEHLRQLQIECPETVGNSYVCSKGFSKLLNREICWGFTQDNFNEVLEFRNADAIKTFVDGMVDLVALIPDSEVSAQTCGPESQLEPLDETPQAQSFENGNPNPIGVPGSAPSPRNVHIVSGEHRQHDPKRMERSRPIYHGNGEHIQHSNKDVNVALSAVVRTETDYEWFKYVPTSGRAKNFNNHHRSLDLSIEFNDVYGVRSGRGGFFYVVDRSDLSVEFKLSDREVALLQKSSKPFTPKSVKAVKADQTAARRASQQDNKGSSAIVKPDLKVNPVKAKMLKVAALPKSVKPDQTVFIAFVQTSPHAQEYSMFMHVDKNQLKNEVQNVLNSVENAIPSAIVLETTGSDKLVTANWGKKARIAKQLATVLFNKALKKPVVMKFTSHPMHLFTTMPKQPKLGIKLTEPIYSGNELHILDEIARAVEKGYFSAEFRPAAVSKTSVKFRNPNVSGTLEGVVSSGVPRLIMACANPAPQYKKEAEAVVERIKRGLGAYGKYVKGKVMQSTIADTAYTILIIGLVMPQRESEDIKRSRHIHEMVKRTSNVVNLGSMLDEINRLTSELDTMQKKIGGFGTEADKARAKAINVAMTDAKKRLVESLKDDPLVMNSPIYSIKVGNAWLSVEVIDYDIPEGTVTVRQVRAGNRKPMVVKELWLFDGQRQVI